MKPTTYAVVDIETTGTDPKEDRIIQFGCVLVENGKIVSSFATDVNPNQAISKQIQHLTGISNTRAHKAPYFEDVAWTIYHLLENTVFVAHNIYFDYSFLSEELKRCGAPGLTIPGIDTVELAQIFLPTEKSFRLSELSEQLGLAHEQPHQADSDAQVTAELFLLIEQKMKQLPLVTMEKITSLSSHTGMQTSDYIYSVYVKMKEQPVQLPKNIHIVDGLALRKKKIALFSDNLFTKKSYAKTKKEKEQLFGNLREYRSEQSRMMNLVYKHFSQGEQKNLFLEAATGIGKSFGYLFPVSYLATPEKPVIISTVSILLQNQLLEKDIEAANQVCPQTIHAVVVKSHRHYIDLQRFYGTLQKPVPQKQYALYQMSVLVWLTQTETGDLDELQLTSLNHLFWKDVTHRGVDFLAKAQPFFEEDFVRHLYQKMKQSNVLIVNHAFLIQESRREQPILPKTEYLIIDEAHHLPDIAGRLNQLQFHLLLFKKQFIQLEEKEQLFQELTRIFIPYPETKRYIQIYQQAVEELIEEMDDLMAGFSESLLEGKYNGKERQEFVVTSEQFEQIEAMNAQGSKKIISLLKDLDTMQQLIYQVILQHLETFSITERLVFTHFLRFFDGIVQVKKCIELYFFDWDSRYVKGYVKEASSEVLTIHDFEASILPSTTWYNRFQRIIYTGGTLAFGKKNAYLPNRLGITDFSFKRIKDTYDYEENACVYIPKETVNLQQATIFEQAKNIAEIVKTVSFQEKKSILVLFTSHELLQKVYSQLHAELMNEGIELLAQGISGTREKLMKRFSQSKQAVLLGADSFWEGVDLPGSQLQIAIVTRLPFENPQRPLVQTRYQFLEGKGIDPFLEEALPKASLRLRQALGRLIRSKTDKGALFVLDRRLVSTKYGKKMQKALPKELKIEQASLTEIVEELNKFLNNSN